MELRIIERSHAVWEIERREGNISEKVLMKFLCRWSDIDSIKFMKVWEGQLWICTCRMSSAAEWLSVSTSSRTVFGCSFLALFYASLSASDRHRWTAKNRQSQESKSGRLNRFQILASSRAVEISVLWLFLLMIPHNKIVVNIATSTSQDSL